MGSNFRQSQAVSSVPSVPPREVDPMDRKTSLGKLMVSFSFSYNLKRFVKRERPESPTDVLDGVRVLSILWVVFGHSYFFPLTAEPSIRNTPQLNQFYQEFFF